MVSLRTGSDLADPVLRRPLANYPEHLLPDLPFPSQLRFSFSFFSPSWFPEKEVKRETLRFQELERERQRERRGWAVPEAEGRCLGAEPEAKGRSLRRRGGAGGGGAVPGEESRDQEGAET